MGADHGYQFNDRKLLLIKYRCHKRYSDDPGVLSAEKISASAEKYAKLLSE
jgi:hypothetical protein